MFINPRTHSPDEIAALESQVSARYAAQKASGTFDPLIQTLLGNVDQASQKTKDLIFGLKDLLGMTPARNKNGAFGVHVEDVADNQTKLLGAFSRAAASLFQDYGIDTSHDISFTITAEGRVAVSNGHPDAETIESLVNGSGLLRQAVSKIFASQSLIDAAANQGSDGKQLTLSADGDTMTGIMALYEDLFAGAKKKGESRKEKDKAKEEERAEQERQTKAALEREWQMKAAIMQKQLADAAQAKADARREMAQPIEKPTFI